MAPRNRQLVAYIDGEPYYAAQKAQEVLGMTYSALRNQVIAGNIEARTPKGKRQLHYKAKDVEQLSREINVFTIRRKNKPTKFEVLKNQEEMKQCQEISKNLFGVYRDIEDLMKTVGKNSETYYVLKEEEQIVGYTAFWPLKPGNTNKILSQTIPVKISPEEIETFEKGKTIDIYISVIGIKPGFSKEEKRFYGARLISGLIDVIVDLGRRGVPINLIAARSNMPDGIRLMRGIGFTEIEPLTPERRTFIIDIQSSGIPFVLQYKEALTARLASQAEQPTL